jgi:hypothetical protein
MVAALAVRLWPASVALPRLAAITERASDGRRRVDELVRLIGELPNTA